MEKQSTREALIQRIADLEAELLVWQNRAELTAASGAFSLADMDHAADGVCICHAIDTFPYVQFSFWNRRMVELTGYGLDEINRKGWYQSVYPDPDTQAKAIARMAAMREGISLEAETWEITRADGINCSLRISTSALNHGDGKSDIRSYQQLSICFFAANLRLRKTGYLKYSTGSSAWTRSLWTEVSKTFLQVERLPKLESLRQKNNTLI